MRSAKERKAYQKAYREAHKEQARITHREWSASNKDKISSWGKRYRSKSKDKISSRIKKWRQNNKEHVEETNKLWKSNNKERSNFLSRVRRAELRVSDPAYRERELERRRRSYVRNKESILPKMRKRKYAARYGITESDFWRMVAEQENRCKSCGTTFAKEDRKNMHIDHCHTTGKVRGVLCFRCNASLGLLREDPGMIRCLVKYAEEFCVNK
jgi:hypothetical protein